MPSTKLVNPGTDDDDESPETVTLSQSKASARGQEIALSNAAAREKQKRKELNRLRDLKLKQRAEETRGSTSKNVRLPSGSADGSDDEKSKRRNASRVAEMSVEDRMERAMREAMDEDGTDQDDSDGIDDEEMEFREDDSEHSGFSDDEDEGDASGSSTGDSEGDEDGDDDISDLKSSDARIPQWKKVAQEEYLPDHIFAAAAATAPSRQPKSSDKTPAGKLKPSEKQKKKRRRQQAKDLIVGAKTIRTIPQTRTAAPILAAASTVPPRRVTKFVKRSLGLTKGDAKRKGWERRPVNIGGMRSSAGPPAHFVRTA